MQTNLSLKSYVTDMKTLPLFIAQQITTMFRGFMMPDTPMSNWLTGGDKVFEDKLMPFITANKPIGLVMLGFPFKSMNTRDKVLGEVPDLGEEVALQQFMAFDAMVRTVYPPGIDMNIASDGYIFNDLMGVFDNVVRKYEDINNGFIYQSPVRIYNLMHFYPNMRLDDARDSLMDHFGITHAELDYRILTDANTTSLYNGMMRFMEQDLAIRPYDSKNQLHKAAKKMAREMMVRNEAFSALVNKEFAGYIRLSMHPSTNDGKKFSFQLVPSNNAKHSPWHSVVLVHSDGTLETIHRKDAVEKGYELVYKNRQPYHFATL